MAAFSFSADSLGSLYSKTSFEFSAMSLYGSLAKVSWCITHEDFDQGLLDVLMRILAKILMKSCQGSLHDLAQVLLRRSCEDLARHPLLVRSSL